MLSMPIIRYLSLMPITFRAISRLIIFAADYAAFIDDADAAAIDISLILIDYAAGFRLMLIAAADISLSFDLLFSLLLMMLPLRLL